jgi:osmotically-inducible protein OsmY
MSKLSNSQQRTGDTDDRESISRRGGTAMTDKELEQHVQNALDWEPSIDAGDIGVSVDERVVTLRGNVGTYVEKLSAERVALRVYGVRAVANDLRVHLVSGNERTDTEIAQAAVAALTWNTAVPSDRVTVTVADGWVTLNGTLEYYHQSAAAERTVHALTGVKGVSNTILLQAPARSINTSDVSASIEAAFRRSAGIDARRINVTARDGKVILSGNVRSWAERREAERAAWAAPGVTHVDDRLAVVP